MKKGLNRLFRLATVKRKFRIILYLSHLIALEVWYWNADAHNLGLLP